MLSSLFYKVYNIFNKFFTIPSNFHISSFFNYTIDVLTQLLLHKGQIKSPVSKATSLNLVKQSSQKICFSEKWFLSGRSGPGPGPWAHAHAIVGWGYSAKMGL